MKLIKQHSLGRHFFQRCFCLLRIMFPNLCCTTTSLFLFLFFMSVVDQVIAYYVGIMPSDYYVVLGNKDKDGFKSLAVKSVLIILAKCMSLSTISYTTSMLYVNWRRLLGQSLHGKYFAKLKFYKLNVLNSETDLDNPDQRMTQDLERLCSLLGQIFWKMIIYPFVAIYYTYKTYQSSGYLGPLVIYVYFILGTVFNRFVMQPVVKLTVVQERREGDFRYKHMSVRSNSEAIAFYDSGPLENLLTNRSLANLLDVQGRLIQWQYALQTCINMFDYMGGILSYLILGFAIFSLHEYDHLDAVALSGVVSRNSFYYMYLINSFSTLIDLGQKFGAMAGNVHRVGELVEYLNADDSPTDYTDDSNGGASKETDQTSVASLHSFKDVEMLGTEPDTPYDSMGSLPRSAGDVLIDVQDVTFRIPGELQETRTVVRNVGLSLRRDVRLLVTGDSSAGKTSFFRMLAGLWPLESGSVRFRYEKTPHGMFFMPQKPYLPLGTLRQQVVYPSNALFFRDPRTTKRIMELLRAVDLEDLVSRTSGLDAPVSWNWHDILSPGEMQRICFCRILFHRPALVFLDEATASVGLNMERKLYRLLPDHGIAYVSVGHRMSLKQFHDHELHIDAATASWHYHPLSRASSYLTVHSANTSVHDVMDRL